MRICIDKNTSKIIESQGGGEEQKDLDVLKSNAINAGYTEGEIETLYVDNATFETLMAKQRESEKTYAVKRRDEYPPMADYLDSKVKQASANPAIQEAGRQQEAKYCADCLAVKAKFQK